MNGIIVSRCSILHIRGHLLKLRYSCRCLSLLITTKIALLGPPVGLLHQLVRNIVIYWSSGHKYSPLPCGDSVWGLYHKIVLNSTE